MAFLFTAKNLKGQCIDEPAAKFASDSLYYSHVSPPKEKAVALLSLKKRMQRCGLQKTLNYGILLQRVGICSFMASDFHRAFTAAGEAVQALKNSGAAANGGFDSVIVRCYYNMATYCDSLELPAKKMEMLDSCIFYAFRTKRNYNSLVEAMVDKSTLLFNQGEYHLCALNALLGETLMKRHYHESDSIVKLASFLIDRANVLLILNETDSLDRLLTETEKKYKTNPDSAEFLYSIYGQHGWIYYGKGDFTRALAYFKSAYRENVALNFGIGKSISLENIGMLYATAFSLPRKGMTYCREALNTAVGMSDSLLALREIANIYAMQRKFDSSEWYFRRCFETLPVALTEKGLTDPVALQNSYNIYQDVLDLIVDKGKAFLIHFNFSRQTLFLDSAINTFRAGDRYLALLKTARTRQFESNLAWRITAHALYENAVEASYQRGDAATALVFFEKSRGILLTDQIAQSRNLTENERTADARLLLEIERLQSASASPGLTVDTRLSLLEQLYLKETEHLHLAEKYNRQQQSAPAPTSREGALTPARIREKLLTDSVRALVELFTGDSTVYVLTISRDSEEIAKIPRPFYDSLEKKFVRALGRPATTQAEFQAFTTTSLALYKTVFKSHSWPPGRLIVSPDEGFYPFEALVTRNVGGNPVYLLEDHALSYTYSAGFLLNQPDGETYPGTRFFGVAPVRFSADLRLNDLPGSDASLEKITGLFKAGKAVYGTEATKNNFLDNFSGYNIIQLYTHASEGGVGKDPVIFFADSSLYLSQLVSRRKTDARLVVMSACETGKGRLAQGEGVFSFNRGFAALGVPAAISNLWSIDNQATYDLTERFYGYLAAGAQTDIALRKAKLDYLRLAPKDRRFPYYWASSVLIGKAGNFSQREQPFGSGTWLPAAGVSGALAMLGLLYWRRKVRQAG